MFTKLYSYIYFFNWEIILTAYSPAGQDTAAAALYEINNFIVHPDYVAQTLENDVAIVKTKKTIVFSSDVGPICLPFRYASNDFTGVDVTALGIYLDIFKYFLSQMTCS